MSKGTHKIMADDSFASNAKPSARVVTEPDPKFRKIKIRPRVVRGSAWTDDQSFTCAHYRYLSRPNLHSSLIGFRVVTEPELKFGKAETRSRAAHAGGSSWYTSQDYVCASFRFQCSHGCRFDDVGFRVVCEPVPKLETHYRALRGGSWTYNQIFACPSYRGAGCYPGHRFDFIGFRVVSEPVKRHQHPL